MASLTQETDFRIGVLCGGLMALLWGGWFVVTRFGLTDAGFTTFDVMFLRFAISGVIVLPFLGKAFSLVRRVGFARVLGISLCGGLAYPYFAYSGIGSLDSGYPAVLINGFIPSFSLLVIPLVLGRTHFKARQISALMMILASSLLFFRPDPAQLMSDLSSSAVGFTLIVCSALALASFLAMLRAFKIEAFEAIVSSSLLNAVLIVPLYLMFFGMTAFSEPSLAVILVQSFYQGVIAAFVASILMVRMNTSLPVQLSSAFIAAVPLVATFIFFVSGEEATLIDLLASVLCCTGIYFLASGSQEG